MWGRLLWLEGWCSLGDRVDGDDKTKSLTRIDEWDKVTLPPTSARCRPLSVITWEVNLYLMLTCDSLYRT